MQDVLRLELKPEKETLTAPEKEQDKRLQVSVFSFSCFPNSIPRQG